MKEMKRRVFLKTSLLASGTLLLSNKLSYSNLLTNSMSSYKSPMPGEMPDIVTITSDNPEENLVRLLDAFGGIEHFVKSGQKVGLLLNSPWKYSGYYTQPDIGIVLADLCMKAGAKEVICYKPAQSAYWERGLLYSKYPHVINKITYGTDRTEVSIPNGVALKVAEVYREFPETDVFISVPVAKHHAGTIFSGNLKGTMGVSSSYTNRHMHSPDGEYTYDNHEHLAQSIADLNLLRKPDLCVIDASVCALSNGPAGPGETVSPGKIIAGKDPLATDIFASSLLGFAKEDILTFSKAYGHGLGENDPSKIKLLEL